MVHLGKCIYHTWIVWDLHALIPQILGGSSRNTLDGSENVQKSQGQPPDM